MLVLSTEQKVILKRIAKEQLNSFLRIVEQGKYKELLAEFEEEGYEVSELEVLEQLSNDAQLWDDLIEKPETFLQRLDELNLSMLKHILLNEFELTPETRGIWKKLNLFDRVNKFQS